MVLVLDKLHSGSIFEILQAAKMSIDSVELIIKATKVFVHGVKGVAHTLGVVEFSLSPFQLS